MKRFISIVLCVISFSALANSNKEHDSSEPLLIVTTIKPLTLLVKQIIGNTAEVYQLLPDSSSPHHYQLNISDRQRLQKANVVLWVGPELETFLEKPLKQRKSGLITASDIEGIHWVEAQHHHGDDHGHNHARDPHLWLDPYNLGLIAQYMRDKLVELAPVNTRVYQQNTNTILRELGALDKRLQVELSSISAKPFIVMHPAYGHFVSRYQLNQQDFMVLTPERGIGARHLYELKQLNPTCVFGEEGVNTKLTKKIASASKATLAMLDPLGVTLSEEASTASIVELLANSFITCLSD